MVSGGIVSKVDVETCMLSQESEFMMNGVPTFVYSIRTNLRKLSFPVNNPNHYLFETMGKTDTITPQTIEEERQNLVLMELLLDVIKDIKRL